MIKGIIFDLDGVLINAKDWHYEALNRALNQYGFEISRADHLTIFDGLPTRKKLEILSERTGLSIKLHTTIMELKQHFTMELIELHCKSDPIHEHALSHLRQLGYKMGVASNSVRQTVEITLGKTHLAPYLDFMLSSEDVKNSKPHPEIYSKAIALIGFNADECLIVEDNINGINAAKAAGACLMTVETVADVNLKNILENIDRCNAPREMISQA